MFARVAPAESPGSPVGRLRSRLAKASRAAYRRFRTYLIIGVQAGLAAALAWVIAHQLLRIEEPTFAPGAAVAVIGASLARRALRTVELLLGIGVGIAAGDLLIALIGTGAWQTGIIVFLAVTGAAAARGTGLLMTQAGATAVLVATLTPANPDLELPRAINALVGGLVGLVVMLVLAPLNPLRTIRRVAGSALDLFARQMTACAEALANGDASQAEAVLDQMRNSESKLIQLREAVSAADEVAQFSPLRWRRRRAVSAYRDGVKHMERAYRNSRTLARRAGTALRDAEPVPPDLPAAIEEYGASVRLLHREFLAGEEPVQARDRALSAVRLAGEACRQEIRFSGTIVVSQLRTVTNDLLRATGVRRDKARHLVRRAAAGH
ncbi:Fusaric acid resistance protein-like [Micromonospora coriariae]|uniref:Fusaric acid resistance protein-like n=1 Tax=Micromonospora coriariae TaxID=285665 RepID=A0A1C4X3V6_9ACTN|nr:FUSC family protein [Micromonospora coriariae]SCF03135.1 Fusaric acid resistance protein-like [Micromonospora coriariae]